MPRNHDFTIAAHQQSAGDNLGQTALHIAAYGGHEVLAEMLLQQGAKVDARDWLGETPLMGAVKAPIENRVALVELFIEKGANVNAKDDASRRLVLQAGFVGDKKTVKKVAKSGNLNTLHEDGSSVLDHAGDDEQIVAMLKQAGARE